MKSYSTGRKKIRYSLLNSRNFLSDMKKQPDHLNQIKNIVVQTLHPERVWLFGSRAEGKNRKQSDYDIAFEGSSSSFRQVRKAKEQISDTIGIYSCDLIDLEKVDKDFRNLVREKGKIIHERN